MPRSRVALLAAVLAVSALPACGLFGGPVVHAEAVDDREILEFSERIGSFYQAVAQRRLNTLLTFEDPDLRSYFGSPAAFADYYASLTTQLVGSSFRHTRADEVHVREFRFDSADRAHVDLTIVGKHERGLRFWDIEVQRTDGWRRQSGVWLLDPERL